MKARVIETGEIIECEYYGTNPFYGDEYYTDIDNIIKIYYLDEIEFIEEKESNGKMADNYQKGDYMSHADLHLGDWVYYETPNGTKKYGRICELGSEMAGIEEEKCRTWKEYEDVERIPITTETLEMFGFEKGEMDALGWEHLYQYHLKERVFGETVVLLVLRGYPSSLMIGKSKMDKYSEYEVSNMQVQVSYIHEIQHCMEVARIEQELTLSNK